MLHLFNSRTDTGDVLTRMALRGEPFVFARVHGANGRTRELRAVVSSGAMYCSIPLMDAYHLGYLRNLVISSVTGEVESDRSQMVSTMSGVMSVPVVTIERISLGKLEARNVETIVVHPPEPAAAEMVLGMTFLRNFRLEYDPEQMEFALEDRESLG